MPAYNLTIFIFAAIIFWTCALCIFHTYILFPFILFKLAKNKRENELIYPQDSPDLPFISIILAAYNEEIVIAEKIESTFTTAYPIHKFELIIGSDASTDKTCSIIKSYQNLYSNLKLVEFKDRTGKVKIINALVEKSSSEIIILTDANVFFQEETIYHLVKHYYNKDIALVGGNILNENIRRNGISLAENSYLQRENKIKHAEGVVWGKMIGVFGGCYSIRNNEYTKVPDGFIVDDFYISMQVLKRGKKAVMELHALAYEDVSNHMSEEYRRKMRISAGNFQNLRAFSSMIWPPWSSVAFAFLSHKVLRWVGPFLIILLFISSAILAMQTLFFKIVLVSQILCMLIPCIDWILKKINIHISLFRFVSHFYGMNLALLTGFFKYAKGIKSNVWKPTERYQ